MFYITNQASLIGNNQVHSQWSYASTLTKCIKYTSMNWVFDVYYMHNLQWIKCVVSASFNKIYITWFEWIEHA